MAIEKCKVKESNIRVVEDTYGGNTYYVTLPGKNMREQALCFRPLKKQPAIRCTQQAGWDTSHLGTGACKLHGGCVDGVKITTGKYSRATKMRLNDNIQKYLDGDRNILLSLDYELAATKAVLDEFLEKKFVDTDDDNYGSSFNKFVEIIGTLGTLVEKISKMETRNTMTAAQVMYLRATVLDLLMKYIPDANMRETAARELAMRMGGDIAVDNIRRSEYTLPKEV
jgi:hypothetical protein